MEGKRRLCGEVGTKEMVRERRKNCNDTKPRKKTVWKTASGKGQWTGIERNTTIQN